MVKDQAGGGLRWRSAGKVGSCVWASSWQCVWALIVAVAILCYMLASLGVPCSQVQGAWRLRADYEVGGAEGTNPVRWSGDLRELDRAWNRLCYGPAPESMRIAVFVKNWPADETPGGLERHAMTLHRVLADRGHEVHVFTVSKIGEKAKDVSHNNLHVHFEKPNSSGKMNVTATWERYTMMNNSQPFHVVHSESVALPHWRARNISSLAASWHGIQFEIIHSDIVQDLNRELGVARSADMQQTMAGRLARVSDEIRFFHSYQNHVGTSDYVGDVLRTIYELPLRNVHIILNGIDEKKFRPNSEDGAAFRSKYGVPENASLVMGVAGRLVRDKGHPLLFEAFSAIVRKHKNVYLLVAGSGPWGKRYKGLAPYVKVLGPLPSVELAKFYNAIDIFVNPTLRSQGLDHTLLEAMQCAKALIATHFSSITWSVIVDKSLGYTFSPNVQSLTEALETVIQDGKDTLSKKGAACHDYASHMFTATKMGSAYERLFLCIKNETYCHYPLPTDLSCVVPSSKLFRSSP